MPIETAIILAAIVAAFTIFGAALAWAERQTRKSNRSDAGLAGTQAAARRG